jgi:hypothetical protein
MEDRMICPLNTPLVRKLGIKNNHRLALLDAPAGFPALLAPLPEGVVVQVQTDPADTGSLDVIVVFMRAKADLQRHFTDLAGCLAPAGGLWVCWPKKASGVATDLTEDVVRDIALAAGLVDNKVCAVDAVWSGLRLVIRVADRKKHPGSARK